MTDQEHEESAAEQALGEFLYELGFPPGRAERIAAWVADMGSEDGDF